GVGAIGDGRVCTLATGVSFSMLTLAFAQLLYAIAFKWVSVTGGSDGLAGIPKTPGPFGTTLFSTRFGFYYFTVACLVGAFLFCRMLVSSPFGAVLRGIRENEAKTLSLGYNTRLYKIAVVAVAYALGGLAGALFAPFRGFANTELLFWLLSGQVLIMVVVGGAGTLIGPILGAAFFLMIEHQLSIYTEAWALFFGLVFIAFVLFAAAGGAAEPLLQLDGLTKAYGALVAVDNVSMRVADGEVRAVIGPNGAGKTTLFHLVTGVVKPTRGSVRFAGEDITGRPAHVICQKGISRTFQLTSLFPEMSARENAIRAAGIRSAAPRSSAARASAPMPPSHAWGSPTWPSARPAC